MPAFLPAGGRRRLFFPAAVFVALLFFSLSGGCQLKEKEKGLTASGTVEATEVKVTAEIGGTLKELFVKEGDRVQAGQTVGRIDDAPYRIAVDQAAAGLAGAEAALDEARAGARAQEIEAARRDVERLAAQAAAAGEQLALDEDSLKRARELFAAGAIPEQELLSIQTRLNVARRQAEGAEAQLAAARERLALLEAGSREETIARLSAGVRQGAGSLELARLNLEKTRLTAPAAGVVAACNFTAGELVRPGAEVVTLLDETDMWINVYVPENKLGLVKVGQPAEIRVDAYPGKVFSGRVEFVSPKAEFTPRNVQTKEERVNLVFRVKVRVADGQTELRPGLPADVTFRE